MNKKELDSIFVGMNNANLERSRSRLLQGSTYKDLSTIMVVPTRGVIPVRVVQSMLGLICPMNQKFFRLFIEKYEVGDAYNIAVEQILNHPDLSKWKYLLCWEEDNIASPDSFIRLIRAFEEKSDLGNSVDVVGGLYWTKSSPTSEVWSQPMIYGDPRVMPRNYIPQVPKIDTLQECNGLGQGFTLFKLDQFKKVPKPWFITVQSYTPGAGVALGTQDLQYFSKASGYGLRFACDTRVKIGHLDVNTGDVW